jgi:hypothetical protein
MKDPGRSLKNALTDFGMPEFMKMPSAIVLGVILVGCESSQPRSAASRSHPSPSPPRVQSGPLSADQATGLAIELANARADATYHCQPFWNRQPARFEAGRWVWRALAPGDLEAKVELAADGSTNNVSLELLSNVILY